MGPLGDCISRRDARTFHNVSKAYATRVVVQNGSNFKADWGKSKQGIAEIFYIREASGHLPESELLASFLIVNGCKECR